MKWSLSLVLSLILALGTVAAGCEISADDLGDDADEYADVLPEDDLIAGDVVGEPDSQVEPTAVPYAIVDTNLARCFDDQACSTCPTATSAFSGQDAQYAGRQPSYQDNGDGTVTDLHTGLMWQQDPGAKMTFEQAKAGAATFSLAGHTDWRLPTIKELYSLMAFSGLDPSNCESSADCALVPYIDTDVFAFQYGDPADGDRLIDAQFASSTEYVSTTMDGAHTMFGLNLADGRIKGYPTAPMANQPDGKLFFVLYVRGNTAYGQNQFADNGDGTIRDEATGLVWTQGDSGSLGAGTLTWEEALAFCESLELAGHDDWRLPDAKELQSIVDYSRSPATTGSAAIDPLFSCTGITDEGGNPNFGFYWTGTTHASTAEGGLLGHAAAYVAFGEALGWMEGFDGSVTLMDVHGAGAQRSDPKVGDAADYPFGFGPQGDVIRIRNLARCVRGGEVVALAGSGSGCTPTGSTPSCADASGAEDCCGDQECDFLETSESCPEDCGSTREVPVDGPAACETQADCEAPGACPAEAAMGCLCTQTLEGPKACIPACDTDADCPSPPDQTLTCAPDGVCVPDSGRRPPR